MHFLALPFHLMERGLLNNLSSILPTWKEKGERSQTEGNGYETPSREFVSTPGLKGSTGAGAKGRDPD